MPDGFRKPDKLDVAERLDPPPRSVRQFDADERDEKLAGVSDKSRQVLRQAVRDLREAANETARAHLAAPRPDRDAFARDIEETTGEILDARLKHHGELSGHNRRRMEERMEELPNITSGPASPGESDVRAWVREAPPEERLDRIRAVVDSGNPEQARALFRESVPAQVAGFPSEDVRRKMQDDALRAAAPETFETVTSLHADLKAMERDRKHVEDYAAKLRNAAMMSFDRIIAEFEARK